MSDFSAASAAARTGILNRLRVAPPGTVTAAPAEVPPPPLGETLYGRFRELLELNRAEVHDTTQSGWVADVMAILREKGCKTLLYAPDTEAGRRLSNAGGTREESADGNPALIPYDATIETMKPTLVHQVDVGLTETRAAIAATGSLVLWPTPAEPRLMSLLPPIHVALVKASTLHRTLGELIAAQDWARGMPTNAVVVSGPSKTADIAQLLAFGVHGPKQLVVMVIQDA